MFDFPQLHFQVKKEVTNNKTSDAHYGYLWVTYNWVFFMANTNNIISYLIFFVF